MGQVTEKLDEDSRSFRTPSKIRSPILSQVNTNTNTTMKKPTTKAQLLADPRIAKIGDRGCNTTDQILWQEYDGWGVTDREQDAPSYWVVLASGWNNEGSSFIHEKTIKQLCEKLDTIVEKGAAY